MRSHLPSGALRRLLYLSLPIAITLVALLGIGALLSVRAAPAPAPLAQSSEQLLRVKGDDTADEFLAGSFYRTGVARRSPAEGGDDDGDVSLLSVGIAGEWEIDSDTALPNIDSHTAEIYKDQSGNEHIYVIGGRHNGTVEEQTEIYSATVLPGAGPNNEDILSGWQQLSVELPDGRSRHASAIVNDYLYVIGGDTNSTGDLVVTDTVYYAPIDPTTAEIGVFSEATGFVPDTFPPPDCGENSNYISQGLSQMAATVVSETVYVIGGGTNTLLPTHCVFYATPDPNTGNIASWQEASEDYPDDVYGNTAVTYEDVIFGASGGDALVFSAEPSTSTWDINNWRSEPNLPQSRRHAEAVAYNGQTLVLGGSSSSGAQTYDTAYANFFDRQGRIDGQWISTSPLGAAVYRHDAVLSSRGWVYVIGGISDGASTDDVTYGTLAGDSSQYTPYGEYTSDALVLDPTNELRELRWTVHAEDHTAVTATVDYRMAESQTQLESAAWQTTTPTLTMNGVQTPTHSFPEETKTTYFQYRVRMGTTSTDTTPIVQKVELVYEVLPPDLVVDKETDVGAVGRGELLTYTIQYQHIGQAGGPDEVTDVVLTETFPAYLDLVSVSPEDISFTFVDMISETDTAIDNETDEQITVIRWYKRYRADLGTIERNESETIQFVIKVTDTLEALPVNERDPSIENEVEIGYPGPDQDPGNNVDSVSNDLALPDLDLVKDRYPKVGDVSPGQTIYYTLTLVNDSVYTATNVVVTDMVPTNTTFVSAGQGGVLDTSTQPRPTVRWDLPTFDPNAAQNLTFRVRVNTDVEFLEQVRNIAEVASEDTLPEESNAVVNTVKTNPQLEISKHVSPAVAGPGDDISYEIRYTNTGDVDLTSVVVSDTLPQLLTFTHASDGGTFDDITREVKWDVGRIPLGTNGSLTLQAAITRPLPAGTQDISNVAWARTETIDPFKTAPSTVTIDASPNLKITKRATPRYDILPGDVVTFTLAYTNVGGIGVADYVITDRLPAGTSFVSASDGGTLNSGVVTWSPASELAGLGGFSTHTLVVQVDSFGGDSNGIANTDYGVTANAYGITEMGDPVYVPGGPDLAATRIVANQTVFRPEDSTAMTIYVGVTNNGGPFDTDGIWVDLYVKDQPVPPADAFDLSDIPTYWYVSKGSIADGAVVRLESDDVSAGASVYPHQELDVGTYYAYAQANTDDADPSDVFPVDEWPRANNIVGPLVFTVTDSLNSPPPQITGVTPNPAETDRTMSLTINGSNFQAGAAVWLERDGQQRMGAVSDRSSSQITASFDTEGQLTGYWDVVVINPDGGRGMLPDGVSLIRPAEGPPPVLCPPDCYIYLPTIQRE